MFFVYFEFIIMQLQPLLSGNMHKQAFKPHKCFYQNVTRVLHSFTYIALVLNRALFHTKWPNPLYTLIHSMDHILPRYKLAGLTA